MDIVDVLVAMEKKDLELYQKRVWNELIVKSGYSKPTVADQIKARKESHGDVFGHFI